MGLVQEAAMQEQNLFLQDDNYVMRYILQHEEAQQLIGRMCAAPLVIRYKEGDELVHTDARPFCGDMACPCHTDRAYWLEYEVQPQRDGVLTHDEAQPLFRG